MPQPYADAARCDCLFERTSLGPTLAPTLSHTTAAVITVFTNLP